MKERDQSPCEHLIGIGAMGGKLRSVGSSDRNHLLYHFHPYTFTIARAPPHMQKHGKLRSLWLA